MALPPRAFFNLHETASRWGCMIADIAGWATEGKLDIVTGIPLAICGTDKVSGKITVSPMDMLPLFRRGGTGPAYPSIVASGLRILTVAATDCPPESRSVYIPSPPVTVTVIWPPGGIVLSPA